MQGYAFMGKHAAPEQPFNYGFRGRMDERYDMVRVVRDKRYIYIRNYMPHKIYGQYISYMFATPTTRTWHDLYHAGKLNTAQGRFWETKPAEELYDLQADPDEVNNSPGPKTRRHSPAPTHCATGQGRSNSGHRLFARRRNPQPRRRSCPYDMGHNPKLYAMEPIMAAAEQASSLKPEDTPALIKLLSHQDSAVRYWAAMGLLMRGETAVAQGQGALRKALGDKSTAVACTAAEALGRYGKGKDVALAAETLIQYGDGSKNDIFTAMLALNGLDYMDGRAAKYADQIKALPNSATVTPGRMGAYIKNLLGKINADLAK